MRGKNILILLTILGASFSGGAFLGQNAAKKAEAEYVMQKKEEPVWNEKKNTMPSYEVVPSETPTPTPKPSTYLLVLSDKEICVYELPPSGDAKFLYAQATEIAQLRQEDYERLCRGIKVKNLEEARALLEDFGS